MLKKLGIAAQSQRLPSAPGLGELYHYLSVAIERRGKHIELSWFNQDHTKLYSLDIMSNANLRDPRWRLLAQDGRKRELLWQQDSCDVLLILNLILTACEPPVTHAPLNSGNAVTIGFARTSSASLEVIDEKHRELGGGVLAHGSTLPSRPKAESLATFPMSGELTEMPIGQLLHSLAKSRATGRLILKCPQQEGAIYFSQGNPIHSTIYATIYDVMGDNAAIELTCWREGTFHFEPDVRTRLATVHLDFDTLMMRGAELTTKMEFLRNVDFAAQDSIRKIEPVLSSDDFAKKIGGGLPIDIDLLSAIYDRIDDKTSIQSILEDVQMKKSQMIVALYYLINHGLIETTGGEVQSNKPRGVDRAAIESVMLALRSAETGMHTYPAFLYFMEQEYFRSYRLQASMAVLIFELQCASHPIQGISDRPLARAALVDVVARVSALKRHIDLLAHYKKDCCVLLLPNTKHKGAQLVAAKIEKALTGSPLNGLSTDEELRMFFGIGSIPEQGIDMNAVLESAEFDLEESKKASRRITQRREGFGVGTELLAPAGSLSLAVGQS